MIIGIITFSSKRRGRSLFLRLGFGFRGESPNCSVFDSDILPYLDGLVLLFCLPFFYYPLTNVALMKPSRKAEVLEGILSVSSCF